MKDPRVLLVNLGSMYVFIFLEIFYNRHCFFVC